jgi:SWI/SNF-related matrix-associated actin-dependent regulator of chromatin subfamily A3
MRQIALHPGLVPPHYLEELLTAEVNDSNVAKPTAVKIKLQDMLAQSIEDCAECPICLDQLPNDARIASCAHIFCISW